MNRPKAIGTNGETAVVRYFRDHGFPGAERRALAGSSDLGDITGLGALCVEVKAGQAAANAAPGLIATWMGQTLAETQNSRADYGLLVTKRNGVGPANAGLWWAYLDCHDLAELLTSRKARGDRFPVRLTLADAVRLLRHAGYGDPLEAEDGAA